MTRVLVHGVPETASIWDGVRAELADLEPVCLSPPGFGVPVPDGFGATSDDYRDWLIAEIEALAGPVDAVGHDWGGGHVARAVAARPDLFRSWCIDIAGCFHPDYVWHDLAQVWQTPGAGEEFVGALDAAAPDDRVAALVGAGMTPAGARACVEEADPAQGACILALYRSAVQPAMQQWGAEFVAADVPPGLVINAPEDTFTAGGDLTVGAAERIGAQVATLDGQGHWWMLHDPATGAAAIRGFLAGLD